MWLCDTLGVTEQVNLIRQMSFLSNMKLNIDVVHNHSVAFDLQATNS